MVGEDEVCKITDFGMTRDVQEEDIFVRIHEVQFFFFFLLKGKSYSGPKLIYQTSFRPLIFMQVNNHKIHFYSINAESLNALLADQKIQVSDINILPRNSSLAFGPGPEAKMTRS